MRKLIVEEWVSLDGYAADLQGKTEFFPSTEDNKQSDEDQLLALESVDTILIGRKTYDIFVDFWPKVTVNQEILSDKLNAIPKAVVSNTLKTAPWGRWPEATVLAGDGVEGVKKLKEKVGDDIIVWGSVSLVQSLMKANLIDEYRIHVCPARLGAGRRLFSDDNSFQGLQLIETKAYAKTGVVLLKYRPKT